MSEEFSLWGAATVVKSAAARNATQAEYESSTIHIPSDWLVAKHNLETDPDNEAYQEKLRIFDFQFQTFDLYEKDKAL
ncbi:MAG: hypothetical protein M1819_005462 [Sarea resinae]|nr:MAG: hypothetical protein M1819_005462 [Sarea resinae]